MKALRLAAVAVALGAGVLWLHFNAASASLIQPVHAAAALREVTRFDLPGPQGKRFDYLTIDYDDNYLLSAHLGAGQLYVIDLK
ncbi:MAG TPA: hypothetical protein VEW69_13005, partial [Alphaproteobacteria bacterium]|nr:hypothetical protein [Alphaproteobacteria bacterium]